MGNGMAWALYLLGIPVTILVFDGEKSLSRRHVARAAVGWPILGIVATIGFLWGAIKHYRNRGRDHG